MCTPSAPGQADRRDQISTLLDRTSRSPRARLLCNLIEFTMISARNQLIDCAPDPVARIRSDVCDENCPASRWPLGVKTRAAASSSCDVNFLAQFIGGTRTAGSIEPSGPLMAFVAGRVCAARRESCERRAPIEPRASRGICWIGGLQLT